MTNIEHLRGFQPKGMLYALVYDELGDVERDYVMGHLRAYYGDFLEWKISIARLSDEILTMKIGDISKYKIKSIPDEVLHRFACSCAIHRLQFLESKGAPYAENLWKAIQHKLIWIRGDSENLDLPANVEAWAKTTRDADGVIYKYLVTLDGIASAQWMWGSLEGAEGELEEKRSLVFWALQELSRLCWQWAAKRIVPTDLTPPYDRIWNWHKFPCASWNPKDKSGSRKGQRCRLIHTSKGPGPINALVEFEDGEQFVVTNAAVRFAMRRTTHDYNF